ncbi:MAG: L-threonylcarbamoyladenylate synthase [Bacillota bacterium]|nr:L-threonylcarbamoyladenylate synthase [Bacillota bacterium]
METRLCDIRNLNSEEALRGLKLAGEILRGGGLVGFPTETVYGLGANAFDAEAVASIFAAKGRPGDNPLIVHVASLQQARELVEFTPLAEKLAERYWPGPLTLVLDSRGLVPASVSAGLSTLAVRLPSHPGALAMLRAAERPIAAPSANLSGRPSPTLASHVLEDMQGRVPLILDGGAVEIGLESTVVDARGECPILLRPGKITQEELRLLCGDCPAAGQADCARPASPGMKYRHYAPQGQLFLVKTWREAEALRLQLLQEGLPLPLLLLSDESAGELQQRGVPEEQIISLGSEARPEEFAHNLFAALREADHRAASHIIGQSIPAIGLGAAVMNRYTKAASKK